VCPRELLTLGQQHEVPSSQELVIGGMESLEIADREVYLVLTESWLLFTQQSQAMWAVTQHAVQ
jgi:hypothetical protein